MPHQNLQGVRLKNIAHARTHIEPLANDGGGLDYPICALIVSDRQNAA
jgi:hypothetical protein